MNPLHDDDALVLTLGSGDTTRVHFTLHADHLDSEAKAQCCGKLKAGDFHLIRSKFWDPTAKLAFYSSGCPTLEARYMNHSELDVSLKSLNVGLWILVVGVFLVGISIGQAPFPEIMNNKDAFFGGCIGLWIMLCGIGIARRELRNAFKYGVELGLKYHIPDNRMVEIIRKEILNPQDIGYVPDD